MLSRNKKTGILVSIIIFSLCFTSKEISKVDSIDPFFVLVAVGSTPTHMDYLHLIKEQLARIGIHISIRFETFQWESELMAFRDFDLMILDLENESASDPFFSQYYLTNGSKNLFGYQTSIDWDAELGTGKNEWYIQNGLEMISNGSLNKEEFCWEWQNYLMDDILPCLPLFTPIKDNNSLQLLVFNIREARPVIGSRHPCPGYPSKSKGLAIRKAISFAINREEIKRVVCGDDYYINHYPINPALENWLNPNIVRYCHNLQVSREYILNIAGFGLLWVPDGNKYGPWPDWEDVCGNNPTTISVGGFSIIICITLISIIYLIRLRRKNISGGKSE